MSRGAASSDDASLAKGWAGQAVALSYLDEAWPEEDFGSAARELLNAAGEAIASHRMTVGLMQGFTGIAWAVTHLSWGDAEATLAIDEALTSILERPHWPGEFDLVSGLAGLGVYGLERRSTSAGQHLVELVVDRLIERAEPCADGLRWFTPPEFILAARLGRAPKGFYNLGMAHGLPAVIAFLADARAAAIAVEKVTPVLDGAVSYLLAQRLPGAESTWPFFVGEDVEIAPARLAWCYGDPGILCGLARAVDVTGDPGWSEALQDALGRMLRRSERSTGIAGASLCHGTAGLALISARLASHLQNEELAAAAAHWANATLALRDPSEALGGYSVWDPHSDEEVGDVQGPGLLAGIAGVALALLACASEREPAWDRAFLLSGPRT